MLVTVGVSDVDDDRLGVLALQSSVGSVRKREWRALQQAMIIQIQTVSGPTNIMMTMSLRPWLGGKAPKNNTSRRE